VSKTINPPEKIRLTKPAAELFAAFRATHGIGYSTIAERLAKAASRNPKLLQHRP
jgi:hypothetical protein